MNNLLAEGQYFDRKKDRMAGDEILKSALCGKPDAIVVLGPLVAISFYHQAGGTSS